MSVQIIEGDCISAMANLGLVDAIVTDPPYHLSEPPHVASGGFGGSRSNERRAARAGFMNKAWDGGDIAFRPETWATCYDVLKPGGYLLAFGGTRTHHRIWSAIEDAGFVIQDTIMWLYGQGWPKHRTQLKPAYEPICVAYKPGGKRELQIDECRIGSTTELHSSKPRASRNATATGFVTGTETILLDHGRWPANVCHDGSDEVMEAFAAFGDVGGGFGKRGGQRQSEYGFGGTMQNVGFGDNGTAARFFYCAKASKADRVGSKHPTVKPIALMRWMVRLVVPPGGIVLDPFAGSGTTAAAAVAEGRHAILIEQDAEYIADIHRRVSALEITDIPDIIKSPPVPIDIHAYILDDDTK